MNKGIRWLIAGLMSIMLVLLFPSNVLAESLGMGPPYIEINDALPGHEYQETIFFQYSDDDDCTLELSAIGDISEWVSFYEKGNGSIDNSTERVIAPVGEWVFITVNFIIPGDARTGTTSGTLIAKTVSLKAESGMSVSLKGSVNIIINIVGGTEESTTTSPASAEEEPGETFTYIEGESTPADTEDESTPIDTEDESTLTDTEDESTPTDTEGEPTRDYKELIAYSVAGAAILALGIGITVIYRRKLLQRR